MNNNNLTRINKTVARLLSNVENIKECFNDDSSNLDSFMTQLEIQILDAYRQLIIIQHDVLIEDLKKAKVTFVEK
jgi:hypothetical protein